MKKFNLIAIIIIIISCSMTSDKQAYQFFDKNGIKTTYEQLIEQAKEADIVLFGELHNNPICHWLQLELTGDLYKIKGKDLVLGAEMFESDGQLILDEYVSGRIRESNFESEAKLWNNYKTDYKPLVAFARKNKLRFIATNVPRRYAALVSKSGFEVLDSLDKQAKSLFAPLPIDYDTSLSCYKNMLKVTGSGGMGNSHVNINLPKAQALKDATMAYFIVENYKKNQLFIHYNGTYHSENFESMLWYLKKLKSKLKVLTISSVEQDDLNALEKDNINKADFILCIPEKMTKTY